MRRADGAADYEVIGYRVGFCGVPWPLDMTEYRGPLTMAGILVSTAEQAEKIGIAIERDPCRRWANVVEWRRTKDGDTTYQQLSVGTDAAGDFRLPIVHERRAR